MHWSAYKLGNGKSAPHTICSDAGYCVLRLTHDGYPTGEYLAFFGRTGKGTSPSVLGRYDSAELAKAAAETHYAMQDATA